MKEERNIIHTVKRRKTNWIGHILQRNCHLKHVIEGKIERREDEAEDVSSYWIAVRERDDAELRKRKD